MLCSYWTDFVLVWEEPLSSREEESKGVGPAHQKVRNAFLNQLRDSGLLQEQVLTRLSLPNPLDHAVPNPPPDFYTCQFRTNKLPRAPVLKRTRPLRTFPEVKATRSSSCGEVAWRSPGGRLKVLVLSTRLLRPADVPELLFAVRRLQPGAA
ncbi:hypothetical protein EYF80_046898 [Liparis tanakae]|uniref:Uncharacterized protein n=1 Tax=Liparis tanakae TaxID=230148 RepID=A0A4Z2FPR6_9TELE|nr:hypothetical protein EYF80_046898 [Liparis tanakae]